MKITLLFVISMFFAVNLYAQTQEKVLEEYQLVENAEFPGGIQNFRTLVQSKITYPPHAYKKRIQGRCVIEFVINKEGKMEEFKVVKKLGYGCDEVAIDAIKSLNTNYTWTPGKNQEGKISKLRKVFPVEFKLDNPKTNPLESK